MTVEEKDEDFLWQCAFIQQEKERQWIIPDQAELKIEDASQKSFLQPYKILNVKARTMQSSDDDECVVTVMETRKYEGVLDIIGGEVWEASLLLCSFLILHQGMFLAPNMNVLELGSGIGLPSYLLTNLNLKSLLLLQDSSDGKGSSESLPPLITLTDYEPSLLRNLQVITEYNYVLSADHATPQDKLFVKEEIEERVSIGGKKGGEGVDMVISALDWSDFDEQLPQNHPSSRLLSNDLYDYVIGSALCYAPFHAHCLSRVIQYYIAGGRCKEIIIIQIAEREGFLTLLTLLTQLNLSYKVSPVDEQVYQFAQTIRCRKISAPAQSDQFIQKSDPAEWEWWSEYCFPLRGFSVNDGFFQKEERMLIKTERESFVILRIFPS